MSRPVFAGMLAVLAISTTAAAQGVSVYAPVMPQYQFGEFEYTPPKEDGWRQVASSQSGFILVYAEQVPPDQINTRVQIEAEAFAVPDPRVIQGLMWLTEQGQAQQVKERGEKLIAFSKIRPLASSKNVLSYALVTRTGGEDVQEVFYVALAPDKTSYLVVKMTTKEPDYRQQAYFSQFEGSLASLVHKPPVPSGSDKASPSELPGAAGGA
jgi:hypothetical protein